MIRKDIDVHLETLAGYINDDDKLVTYKWLSKELGIHVNLSKQLLFEYWENNNNDNKEKKNSTIIATFLIMGYVNDGNEMRIEIVKEDDRNSAKKNFTKILSEHIYSLQNSLPEIELLAITEKGDCQQSAVRCLESVIRSDYEMEILRWGSNLPGSNKLLNKNTQNSNSSKIQKEINNESKTIDNLMDKESTSKITTAVIKPVEKTHKNAFNNLFAKAIDKQNKEKASGSNDGKKIKGQQQSSAARNKTSPPKNAWFEAAKKNGNEKDISVQTTVDKKTSNDSPVPDNVESKTVSVVSDDSDDASPLSQKKGSWFESKKKHKSGKEHAEAKDCSIKSNINEDHKKRKEDAEESMDSEKKIDKKESPSEKIIGSGVIAGKKKAASSSRGKKRQSTAKNESINKKRKRIVVVESSEESSASEIEDIREPDSPEEPKVIEKIRKSPSPPLVKCEGGRRKVRKLVDRTFKDEDGYFVTQKEYVYESCSEKEEEEEEVKIDVIKPSTSEPTTKTANKRKQATLFNFFKKS